MDLSEYTPAHRQAFLTDAAWSVELTRQFGKRSGDVRYSPAGKGEPGSALRAIYDARMTAQAIWHAEIRATLHGKRQATSDTFKRLGDVVASIVGARTK